MKNPLRFWIILSVLASGPSLVLAQSGVTSANFLKVGMGARPAAMADAFTAVSDDVSAIYWNPAGLALTKGIGFSATHGEWLQGVKNDFLAGSMNLGKYGAVGLSITTENTGQFLSTVQTSSGAYGGTGSLVSATDGEISAAYAFRMGKLAGAGWLKDTYMGLKLNWVFQDAIGNIGNAFSVDLGLLQRFQDLPLTLGLSLQNIGTDIQDRTQPFLADLGAAWRFDRIFAAGDWANLAAEADYQSDSYLHPALGLEYRKPFNSMLASLRLGWRTTDDLQGFSALTAGAGLSEDFNGLTASLDYALAPYGILGLTHRVTLSVEFLGTGPVPETDLTGPSSFTPGQAETPLGMKVQTDKDISSWTLSLTDAQGKVVRVIQGEKNPPSSYDWDGKDANGTPLDAGDYRMVFSVRDAQGNAASSKPLALKALAPVLPSPSPTASAKAAEAVKPPAEVWTLSGDTLFDSGKAELKPAGLEALGKVAHEILDHPQGVIEISGHTDNRPLRRKGPSAFADNLALSQARAQSVRDFFVTQGVDASRLTTVGYGDTRPAVSNATAQGRAKNRRVEFRIIENP